MIKSKSRQKGQITLAVLLLIIIGFILYNTFSGTGLGFSSRSKSSSRQKPVFEQETNISAPSNNKNSTPDTAPPKRSNPQPAGSLPAETRQAILGLKTDEKATCRYSDVSGVAFDSMQHSFSETNTTSHTTLITGLSEGGAYKYYIKCIDEQGNKNTDDFIVSFSVKLAADKTPPVLSNYYPNEEVLPASTTQAQIGVSTNEPASCRYSTEQGKAYNAMGSRFSAYDQSLRYHIATVRGLKTGNIYEFFIRCQDLAGNANTGDVMIRFGVGI